MRCAPARTVARTLGVLAAALLLAAPARPQDAGGGAGKTIKDLFKGNVASVKGRRVEIRYDFSDPAQAADWAPAYPFLRPASSGSFRVEGKAARGDGNAGWRHRAVFDGELKLTATLGCPDGQNFGAMVLDEEKTQFDLFALGDTIFSLMDRKRPLQHMLTTFLPAGQGPGGATEWRYVQSSWEPRIGADPVDVSVRKRGTMNEFLFAGSGKLAGSDREAHIGPRLAAGLYTLGSRVTVTKATVSGVLDAAWLRQQGAAFEDTVPEDPDALEPEKDKPKDPAGPAPAPAPGPDAKAPGAAPEWAAIAARVANNALPKEQREVAADSLVETKDRHAIRPMIDLIYRDDDPVGRDLGNRVFKALSGKETGYRGDLPKDARLKLMPRLWETWYQVKDQLDKEDAKKAKEK